MEPFKEIEKYCETVCDQIRWKRAKAMISKEIENHLVDQRDAYVYEGYEEIVATEKAIVQMGDPVTIGEELDKTHKPKPQWGMIGLTIILMSIGCFVNYYFINNTETYYGFSVFSYVIAIILFFISYFFDFRILSKYPRRVYYIVLILSILGILFTYGENRQWYWGIGFRYLNAKSLYVVYPLVFTLFLYSLKDKGILGVFYCGFGYLPFAIILLITSATAFITYTLVCLTILLFAISRDWFTCNKKLAKIIVITPTIVVSVIIIVQLFQGIGSSFRGNRIQALIDPYSSSDKAGFNNVVLRELINGANLFGKGEVNIQISDINDFSFLLYSEYSLAYMIHEGGLILLFAIVVLIGVFSYMGIVRAVKEKSILGSILALTIILTFVLQSVLYIIGTVGYGLFTPISLPLISYGDKALYLNAVLVGFMLSVFRTGETFSDYSEFSNKKDFKINTKRVIYENGKLILNFK